MLPFLGEGGNRSAMAIKSGQVDEVFLVVIGGVTAALVFSLFGGRSKAQNFGSFSCRLYFKLKRKKMSHWRARGACAGRLTVAFDLLVPKTLTPICFC